MRIDNHKLTGAAYSAARTIGGEITPSLVVLHDTAGRLETGNSAAYLAASDKVSVHFVLERDGSLTQLVPTNRRAAHAGKSTFHGRADCNAFSIGIEIVNPGRMTRLSETQAATWYGQQFAISQFDIKEVETREHGKGLWMAYSEPQITALLDLLEALFRDIPSLTDITTHWYISPGRKVDTNPLFPLDHVRARILGRDDPADIAAEAGSQPVVPTVTDQQFVTVETPGDTLNLRRWPNADNPNVIAQIPDDTIVAVHRRGIFNGRLWLCVSYGGHEGWILGVFAAPIVFSHS